MSPFGRRPDQPRGPEAGDCPHGGEEATCPECLEDIKTLARNLERSHEPPKGKDEPTVERPGEKTEPFVGICPHGGEEATCPECLEDIRALTRTLRGSNKPPKNNPTAGTWIGRKK